MEFGWKVPEFSADGSDITTLLRQTEATLDLVRGRWHSAWVTDHFVPWAKWQAIETPVTECWTILTFLASRYPDLTWGTIVMSQSYRNPALLAKAVANLCAYLPGKVVYGIGAGWKRDEYDAYGYPFPSPATRVRQMEDAIVIAHKLWTEDDVTYAGREYGVQNAYCNPKPNPLPPVMIGGGGEQLTLRVVARRADWWNFPGGTAENYGRKLDLLRGYCAEAGRDYDAIRKTWQCETVAIAETEAEARAMAEASPFYNGSHGLIGTPQQVIAQIEEWEAVGVSLMQLRFADFPRTDGIRLFTEAVMPHFA